MMRRLAAIAGATFVIFILAEVLLRIFAWPELQFRYDDARLHCLVDDPEHPALILLCPDQEIEFQHPRGGFRYRVTTNSGPDRAVSFDPGLSAYVDCATWIIGDSLSMGYGVDDHATFARLLSQQNNDECAVQNIAVDSLGAMGILASVRRRLEENTLEIDRAFWILSASDFVDDERDTQLRANPLRSFVFRMQFRLSRCSMIWNAVKILRRAATDAPARNEYEAAAASPEIPDDHPTYVALRQLADLLADHRIPLHVIVYPEIDRDTGHPLERDVLKELYAAEARRAGAKIIDVSAEFHRHADDPELYLPEDGHPGPAAQRIFLQGILPR